MQQVALNRKNCTLLYGVPLTPAANPEEYWWGTGKGDFGRKFDGKKPATLQLQSSSTGGSIAIYRKMTIKGANSDSVNVSANVMCEKYISASVMWSQLNLVPHSKLADCGFIGEFDLSKAPGAQELLTELTASDSAYYRI